MSCTFWVSTSSALKSGDYECRRCPRGCVPGDSASRLSWEHLDENEPSNVEKYNKQFLG